MNQESASALASLGAGNGDPLVNRKVSTQAVQSDDQSNSQSCSTKDSRVMNRWRTRSVIQRLLRGALPETEWPRVVRCGWSMQALVTLLGAKGKASWNGVEHCNSIWACPCCSARIREGRRKEILQAVHVARERKWRMFFVTFTVPHTRDVPLKQSLKGLTEAFRRIRNFRSLSPFWNAMQGFIKAVEVQVGSNGFHPHLHVLVMTDGCDLVNDSIEEKLKKAWGNAVVKAGLARPKDSVGVTVEETLDPERTADYLVKVQENKLSLEMTRADLKQGRGGSETEWHCSPFDLINEEVELPISFAQRQKLFVEFFRETKGVSAIRWSRGFKKKFDVEEVSDEELGTLTPEEAQAELRFVRANYKLLFKEKPWILARCQEHFQAGEFEKAGALAQGYGELILVPERSDKSEEEPDWGL